MKLTTVFNKPVLWTCISINQTLSL